MELDLIFGFVTGIIFGILLQRSETIRYMTAGALRLLDFTILKFMLSTIIVAMIGTYFLRDLGVVKLSIKPTILESHPWRYSVWHRLGLLGYCPGTSLSFGEGV